MPRNAVAPLAAMCLILVGSGCASSPAQEKTGEYQKGAYRPVRPPTFSPAEDAPHTVGQPGHVRPGVYVEPGPKPTRVLPQTPATAREPGLWSGDAPQASLPRMDFNLGRVQLPYPRTTGVGPTTAEMVLPTHQCATGMSAALRALDLMDDFAALFHQNRSRAECFAAELYAHCTEELSKRETNARARAHIEAAKKVATDFRQRACAGGPLTAKDKEDIERTQDEWGARLP